MVSEPREKKKYPNYFQFIRESILGNFSMTVFHSGHLPHLLKLSSQPYRCQKTLTAGDFSGNSFWRSPFPHRPYHQVCKEEFFKFYQSTRGRISVTCRPRTFLLRRPEPHTPARGALSSNALPPPASPDAV